VLTIKPVRENNKNYHFVYPLLFNDLGSVKQFFKDLTLEDKINNYIRSQYSNNNVQSISVSFRHFPDGKSADVNENDQYHPGSMMKVLIMMAYFREAELDSTILKKTFEYSEVVNQRSNSVIFSQPTELTIGKSYAVQELMQKMIANSDNGAEELLLDNVDNQVLNQAYIDLNIPSPDANPTDYTISPAQYSDFLRILYNSTYLTEYYSEQSLAIMAQSTYLDGLVAGVPSSVIVSQKYGERVNGTPGNIKAVELHNCGIVYAPNHPYELCIMTKGSDIDKLANSIKDISSLVYNYVEDKYK
jgi:beta-lactamase class A